MGAGISQDQASEQKGEESSKNGQESKNQSSKQVSLPHNCEDILKHADSTVDISSTNIQEILHTGVFLNKKGKASVHFF